MAKDGFVELQRIIVMGDDLGRPGDIQDLFEDKEYLQFNKKAFGKDLKVKSIKGEDPIVARIARYEGVERVEHGRPADSFLRN